MEQTKKKKWSGIPAFLFQRGRIWILLGGMLAAIALIFVGGSLGRAEEESKTDVTGESLAELEEYTHSLEEELSHLCASVSGVSHVEVMVCLEGGMNIIYATDGSGNPTTIGSGSSETPLYAGIKLPSVAGVGIVCRGGNDPSVQRKLIQLVSTTLDISSSRVFVTGK